MNRACLPFTPDEARALLSLQVGRWWMRDVCLLALMMETGLRVSQAVALDVKDVVEMVPVPGTDRRAAQVVRYLRAKRAKGGAVPVITLSDPLRELITRHVGHMQEKGYFDLAGPLFRSQSAATGYRMTRWQAWRCFKRMYAEIGLQDRGGTHCARKTTAMWTFEQARAAGHPFPISVVQDALFHTDLRATKHYTPFLQYELTGSRAAFGAEVISHAIN